MAAIILHIAAISIREKFSYDYYFLPVPYKIVFWYWLSIQKIVNEVTGTTWVAMLVTKCAEDVVSGRIGWY